MEDLIKGELDWHNKVNSNFHEVDSQMAESMYYQNISTVQCKDTSTGTNYWLTTIKATDIDGTPLRAKLGFAGNEINNTVTFETVRSFSKRNNASFAINAGLFTFTGTRNTILGTVIKDGVTVVENTGIWSTHVLGIKADGTLTCYPSTTTAAAMLADGVIDAVTAFSPLVLSGIATDLSIANESSYLNGTINYPRQIIAQYTNKDILILTVDGKYADSPGLTIAQCQTILVAQGVNFAYALDGGGSAQTVVRDMLINSKIDNNRFDERVVATFLYFSKDPVINRDRDIAFSNQSLGDIESRVKDVENRASNLENTVSAYGIKYTISTDTMTRLGNAVSKVANISGAGNNDFDSIMPWSGIRRCNVSDGFIVSAGNKTTYSVSAYYGDATYKEDGTNGQVMVEVPGFYYQRYFQDSDNIITNISMLPLPGYKWSPWHYDANGNKVDKKYFAAYEGSIYDVSASAYLMNDEQVADFTASTGDKLCSISGAKPCSGVTQNLTLPNSRILATNRGTGWQQQYFTAVSMIEMLFMVEYASLNSQTAIGQGVVSKTDDTTSNLASVTGATSSLGNKSGRATGTDGQVSISYRGIENFWGNINKWVDGINIQNSKPYVSKVNGSFASDTFSGNYVDSGITISSSNGYMSKAGLNYNFDYGFLPIETAGTSTSKYADYISQIASGNFVAMFGEHFYSGKSAGIFSWDLHYGSTSRSRIIGSRLVV